MTYDASPLITTIIPTYRRPQLLRRAVLSVLDQQFPRLQICVYDNASDDSTAEVVAQLAQMDPRIKYHRHPENIGAAANFEFGLRAVSTPFFSILSDDDYLIPGFYRRAVDDLAGHRDAMFWAGLTMNVDEEGVIWDARVARWPREGRFEPPEGVMRVTRGMSPTWTGMLFRQEVLELVGFPDQETLGPSDLDFVLRVTARHPFLLYKVPSAVFTLNSASFSATQPLASFWPGWKRMLAKVASDESLDSLSRAKLLARLHTDARRMLLRRGANAIAGGRQEFAKDAADALRSEYGLGGWAALLRTAATLCDRNGVLHAAYRFAYRVVERSMIRSRIGLEHQYGSLIARKEERVI